MELKKLDWNSRWASDLNQLINSEWSDVGEFKQTDYGIDIPNPIGIVANGEVIGGLSFTSYQAPQSEDIAVWINAVLVKPQFRRQGLGSQLIRAAHSEATALYALTDIPTLYSKLGWEIVQQTENGYVVRMHAP